MVSSACAENKQNTISFSFSIVKQTIQVKQKTATNNKKQITLKEYLEIP